MGGPVWWANVVAQCSTWWPNMGGPMYNRAEETPLRAHKLTWQLPDKGGSLLRAQRQLPKAAHSPPAAEGDHAQAWSTRRGRGAYAGIRALLPESPATRPREDQRRQKSEPAWSKITLEAPVSNQGALRHLVVSRMKPINLPKANRMNPEEKGKTNQKNIT